MDRNAWPRLRPIREMLPKLVGMRHLRRAADGEGTGTVAPVVIEFHRHYCAIYERGGHLQVAAPEGDPLYAIAQQLSGYVRRDSRTN